MTEELGVECLSSAVSATALMEHLVEFARRMKLSGTPEELESFRYLRSRFDALGYRTQLLLHDAYISLPVRARLLDQRRELDCITHSFSCASPPGGLRGRVVYGGHGTRKEFARIDARGKIVLLEAIANPAASLNASQHGAIGQIHISPHRHLHEMCISSVWGSPTPEQAEKLPSTVVLSVRKADGDALKARVQSGEDCEVALYAEVDTGWRKTPILVAELDAPAGEDNFVMFSGHHDTWYYGVMDNGGANASMLEVARLMAERRAEWRRGLRFCFWSGHSHGRYSGSSWYADHNWRDLERRCVAHVNADSTGGRGNTVLSDALTSSELLALASEAVQDQGGQKLDGNRMSRAGDQSFWGIGVPSVFMGMGEQPIGADNVMSAVLGGSNRQAAGFGWWWHTPEDTLDKMDPEILVRDTKIFVQTVWRLLRSPVVPLDYARHAAVLLKELSLLAAKLNARMNLSDLIDRVVELERDAARVADRARKLGRIEEAAPINSALIKVSRAMVPMDYTNGDRFSHDPALPQNAYPVLDPLRILVEVDPNSDAGKFAAVAARRALNRVSFAVDQANAALRACLQAG